MVLIPFISYALSLFYDFWKLMLVWMPWIGLCNCVWISWFSLTNFLLSNWAENWHAIHWICPIYVWIFVELIELIWYAFEWDSSVWLFEVANCMIKVKLCIKWIWWMIWAWDQLHLLLNCFNVILGEYYLLFRIFYPFWTLGLA
jgi:hypothetical protein